MSDTILQKILYLYLDPMFRLMHHDKYNIMVILIGFLVMYCDDIYAKILLGILGLTIYLIKTFLLGNSTKTYYYDTRIYKMSFFDVANDVPTLVLNERSPYENGYAYGIIMCNEIIQLVTHFKSIVPLGIPFWMLKSIDTALPVVIKDELRGLFDALNEANPNSLTYYELLAIQLIPELSKVGCTCYAVKENGHIKFGRNMDWLSFASAQYSIIVHYVYDNYKSLVMPGMIGCITAWNNKFVMAMNVGYGDDEWRFYGTPSTLGNKMLMIKANTAEEAHKYAAKNISPCYSHHLTIADKDDVVCYSYTTRSKHRKVFKRKLSQSDNGTLSVLNWTYPKHENGIYISNYRNKKILNNTGGVAEVLQDCQSFSTIHALLFDFRTGTYQVACNNGYAADALY